MSWTYSEQAWAFPASASSPVHASTVRGVPDDVVEDSPVTLFRADSPGRPAFERRVLSPFGNGGRAERGAPEAKLGFPGLDNVLLLPVLLLPVLLLLLWKLVRSLRTADAVPNLESLSPNRKATFSEAPLKLNREPMFSEDRVPLRKDVRDIVQILRGRDLRWEY